MSQVNTVYTDIGSGAGQTGGSIYGYNKEQIEALRGVINVVAQDSASGIVDILKSEVVDKAAEYWYAPDAQEFFRALSEDIIKPIGASIKSTFDYFREDIQKAGTAWAQSVGSSELPVLPELDDVNLILPYDSIKDKNSNGNVYLDEDGMNTIIASLPSVEQRINDKMTENAGRLDASCAFLGGNQSENINNLFKNISANVAQIFAGLSSGENSLASAMKSFIDKYTAMAESVATAYQGGVGDVAPGEFGSTNMQ